MKVKDVLKAIDDRSPFSAALEWDNSGLLAGGMDWKVSRILLALDCTDYVIDYAIDNKADLIITHHPLIFSSIKRITDDDFIGRRIIKLISNGISYIAMHTNYDSFGMADAAAGRLGIKNTVVLDEIDTKAISDRIDGSNGIGRVGTIETSQSLEDFAREVRDAFSLSHVRFFGDGAARINRVAICPGSGKSEIKNAIKHGADVLVTGDIDHHSGIDAVACGLNIIDAGHHGIEHIFTEDEGEYLSGVLGGNIDIIKEPIREPFTFV